MEVILHHMGARMVPTVRQICKLYALSGSPMRSMGAAGAIWEPYGSPVGYTGGGWDHMGANCAICEPSAQYRMRMAYGSNVVPYGRQMAPYGRQMGLIGSSVHSMGPIL
jgi:hypothetical protein